MGYGTSYAAERELGNISANLEYIAEHIECELSNITNGCYNLSDKLSSIVTGSQSINENLYRLNESIRELIEVLSHEKQCK